MARRLFLRGSHDRRLSHVELGQGGDFVATTTSEEDAGMGVNFIVPKDQNHTPAGGDDPPLDIMITSSLVVAALVLVGYRYYRHSHRHPKKPVTSADPLLHGAAAATTKPFISFI